MEFVSESESDIVWETVEPMPAAIEWEVVSPNREVVNHPHVDTGLFIVGCQFCDQPQGGANKHYVLNSKTCYVACNNGECMQKAAELVGRINMKIEETVDMFLTLSHIVDNQVMLYGEIYHLQSGSATAVYDQTDPRVVSEQNFSVQVMTDNPVGQRKIIYLSNGGMGVEVSQNSLW